MDEEQPVYIGINLPARQGVSNQVIVDAAIAKGYDLITSRITSRTYRKRVQALYSCADPDPKTPTPVGEDLVVFPGNHISNTIALCAPWAELDSKDSRIAILSYKVLEHEIAYAKFCGLPYVVIEGPKRRTNLARFAHSLSKLLRRFPDIKLMVHTTFTEDFRDDIPPLDMLSTWEVWDGVRTLCGHPENLGVTLDVQHYRVPNLVISRWMCEPVMMLILGEATAFVANPKNYPVLPKHTQAIVRLLATLQPFFLIKENLWPHKTIEFKGGDDACLIYLRNLLPKPGPQLSDPRCSLNSRESRHVDAESFTNISDAEYPLEWDEFNYLTDVLETPLQPLHNELSSRIYEIFEADAVKYEKYFRAVCAAIVTLNYSVLGLQEPLTIAVLGAGRGALVDRVLDAVVASRVGSNREVRVYAVEKHSGPLSYLEARKTNEPEWKLVDIVRSDIRDWVPRQPVHLVVSELLGSFGDNELSPECLYEVEHNPRVLAGNGIMIPQQYTSFVAPVYSPILWSKARKIDGLERPHVVHIRQAELLADPQPVWQFNHPPPIVHANVRSAGRREAKVSFTNSTKSRIYGFTGYFEAKLYKDITLSILPGTLATPVLSAPGLKSWFPFYFPIKQPLDVLQDGTVDISIWRECDRNGMWYEWAVETHNRRMRTGCTTLHNTQGSSYMVHLR